MQRQMAMQNQVMQFADQQMQFMGMQQKAELSVGATPRSRP
jgi:hypothetical protein